mmetsp:Transcript_41467/g.69280  ORF Transcript_41467/g.69280 Transcript_41467/m.69280 type:complete len:151 (-) Transcript_41467:126-578(-)
MVTAVSCSLALGLSAIGRNVYPELKTVTMFAFNGKEADGLAEAIALADVLVPDENGTTRKLSSKEMDLKKEVASISNAVEASVSPSIKRKQKKDRHDDGNETKQKTDECEKNLESNAGDHQVRTAAQPQDLVADGDEKGSGSKPEKSSNQ